MCNALICEYCGSDRLQEVNSYIEGDVKYVEYSCPVCKDFYELEFDIDDEDEEDY